MQRTTIRLPDELLESAKGHARRTGRTLTQLIEDGVRAELSRGRVTRVSEAGEPSDVDDPGAERSVSLADSVQEIQQYVQRLKPRARRTESEILGLDAFGLPT